MKLRLRILFFWLCFALPAHAKLKSVSLDALAPDQGFAGFADAARKADAWLEEAKRIAQTRGTSLRDEVVKVLNRELQSGVESYVSPDGLVRISDGHHRVLAARKLLADLKIPAKKIEFAADVVKDFHDENWEKYVKWREAHHPTYFPDALNRKKMTFEEVVAYYKGLPKTFDEIRNLPMRSATGRFFDAAGLKGSSFKPYVQFVLGEELKDLGIEVKPGEEFSFEVQKQIRDAIFKGRSSPRLLKLLREAATKDEAEAVSATLDRVEKLIVHQPASALASGSVETLYGSIPEGTRLRDVSLTVPSTRKEFSALLAAAQERYGSRVDHGELKDILKALRDGEELSGAQVKYLKEARKSAINLRSAIKLLGNDDAKNALKQYRNFVTELGNLNDKIAEWDFEGKVPGSIRSSARDVLGLMDKGVTKVTIPPKTAEEFAQMQAENLAWLKKMLGKKELSIGEYHDMRKMVRDYKGLLELIQEDEPTAEGNAVLDHLSALSKKMGNLKDGLMIPTKESKALKFIQRPTKIDPETREDLDTLASMMEEKKDAAKLGAEASCPVLYKAIH